MEMRRIPPHRTHAPALFILAAAGSSSYRCVPTPRPPVVAEDIAPRRPCPRLRPTAPRTGPLFSSERERGAASCPRVRTLLTPSALPSVPEVHVDGKCTRHGFLAQNTRPPSASWERGTTSSSEPPPRCLSCRGLHARGTTGDYGRKRVASMRVDSPPGVRALLPRPHFLYSRHPPSSRLPSHFIPIRPRRRDMYWT
ncbi:hypothetical protein B0H13DRAFT_2098925 [Mycena leptocephala]|nr:hypothetical protein B0H13DRAFT_2098925 [Mycena leptocephala]